MRRKKKWEEAIEEYAVALKDHLKENPEILEIPAPTEPTQLQLDLEKMAYDDVQSKIKNREITLKKRGHSPNKTDRHNRFVGVKKYVANKDILDQHGNEGMKSKNTKIYDENGVLFKG
jgi:hypothetical protein